MAGSNGIMGKMFDQLGFVGKIAKKHPKYTAVTAIVVGLAIFAVLAFQPSFLPTGALTSTPMGYLLPAAVLSVGLALALANYLAKETKYAPVIRRITALVVPVLVAGAGVTLLSTGVSNYYGLIGIGLIVATPAVIAKYSISLWKNSGKMPSLFGRKRGKRSGVVTGRYLPKKPKRSRVHRTHRKKTRRKRKFTSEPELRCSTSSMSSDTDSSDNYFKKSTMMWGKGPLGAGVYDFSDDEYDYGTLGREHREESLDTDSSEGLSDSTPKKKFSKAEISVMKKNNKIIIPEEWDDIDTDSTSESD